MQFHVEETQAALCSDGNEKWWQDGLTEGNIRTLDKFLVVSDLTLGLLRRSTL
jgi:4,5-dihydroxyphthalate decarboxylase